MIRRILSSLVVLIFFPDSGLIFAREAAIQYQSPLPGARLITPQTNIILRAAAPVDPSTVGTRGIIIVSGSASGSHAGELTLSDDGQTMLFTPTTQFAVGETVTVSITHGLRTIDGREITPTSFMFYILQRIVPSSVLEGSTLLSLEGLPARIDNLPFESFGSVQQQTSVRVDTLPPDFPHIQADVFGSPSPGRIFIADMVLSGTNISYIMIVDDFGTPVFYRRTSGDAFDFKPQPNGLLTYCDISQRAYYALDATYAVVDSFRCGNGYPTDVHDLRILPNAHAVLMSYDPQVVDMSQIVPGGDTAATVFGLIVQELDARRNVVFQWRSWDHFLITDATHENLTAHTIDYVHGNSIEIGTDGNFILSSRHMDEVTKISRQTGDIIWRWGGRHNEFVISNDSIFFSHQHAVRRIQNGHITMFDNGNFHTPPFSRAIEYSLDEGSKIATVVWQYRNTPDIYGRALGYVQRFSNGNTLIGWGAAAPTVMEVRPDGSVVSELSFDPPRYSYRAYRFDWNPTSVSTSPATPNTISLSQNYPNPFNPTTRIVYRVKTRESVKLSIFDVLGREVAILINEAEEPGEHSITFDGSNLGSGMYFYRLNAGQYSSMRKAILLK